MRYDIEADWQLLNTCNYRCAYCFFSDAVLGEKLTPAATPEAWQAAFDATGLTWLLHITGGEPTLYPDFALLCERLTQKHYVSFNSNLSHPSVRGLIGRVDPARVHFINAGLHAVERQRKQGLPVFLENVAALRAARFPVIVSIVATSAVLADVEGVSALLQPLGLVPVPKVLRGQSDGKMYPSAYTAEERYHFRRMSDAARAVYAPGLAAMSERPTIDPFHDDRVLHRIPTYAGRACEAGHKFVSISPAGDVYRCSHKTRLGNLLDSTMALRPEASACDTHYCFYFCEKYAAPVKRTVSPGLGALRARRAARGAIRSGAF